MDVAPIKDSVVVGGVSIDISGVSARGIAHLLARFPELRKLMTGMDVEADDLMRMGGDCVNAIIAAGCGYLDNKDAEARVDSLGAEAQLDMLTKILKLTMPGGIGPFAQKLAALGGSVSPAVQSSTAPDTTSPSPSTN